MNKFLSDTFENLLFHPATVKAIERLGERFYLASMEGESMQGVTWTPGQTIQFLVGSFTKRAYTPMDIDPRIGAGRFLFYQHGQGPASEWAASLQQGDVCKLMRPKNSIDFAKHPGSALFFGDETSFAAAQTLQQSRKTGAFCHSVIEVDSIANARSVVAKLELKQVTLLQKTKDGSHLEHAVQELKRLASSLNRPAWYFTGCALSIQTVRKRLKADSISLDTGAVKAYWSPGRKGID